MEKECFKCHQVKPLEEFYPHPQMADGHLNKCKECTKQDVSEHAKTDEGREWERQRFQKPERKAWIREYRKVLRARYPDRYRARLKAGRAKLSGELVPPPVCSVCGGERPLEMHHTDYAKPLEVTWVCRACHHNAF